MKPFAPQEVLDALPKISVQAQMEIHNVMLAARVEAYELVLFEEDDDEVPEPG